MSWSSQREGAFGGALDESAQRSNGLIFVSRSQVLSCQGFGKLRIREKHLLEFFERPAHVCGGFRSTRNETLQALENPPG